MENTHSDDDRLQWLEDGGMARIIMKNRGLTSYNKVYEYRIRLNNGSPEVPWRYSEPFTSLRAACDFGIENPLTK